MRSSSTVGPFRFVLFLSVFLCVCRPVFRLSVIFVGRVVPLSVSIYVCMSIHVAACLSVLLSGI